MSFFGGLAQGFTQAYATQSQIQANKRFKDLQVKKLKTDLDLAEQQAQARAQLNQKISSGMTITDVLKDPGSQSLLLQSGLANVGTLFKESRLAKQQSFLDELSNLYGEQPIEQQPQQQPGFAAPGQPTQQPGFAIPEQPAQQPGLETGLEPGQTAPMQTEQPVQTGQRANIPPIDPLSILRARGTGDIGELESPKMTTSTIQMPQGKMVVEWPVGRPHLKRIVGPAPASDLTAEQTGRLTALANASDIVFDFKNQYLGNDGQLKLSMLDIANIALGTPKTIGRKIRNRLNDAIDAVIKARTGAGAGSGEQETYEKMFLPQIGDDPDVVLDKINRIQKFADRTLDLTTLPESIRNKIIRFESSLGSAQPSQQSTKQTKPLSDTEKNRKAELQKEIGF
jgi:hypothetical protein